MALVSILITSRPSLRNPIGLRPAFSVRPSTRQDRQVVALTRSSLRMRHLMQDQVPLPPVPSIGFLNLERPTQ